MSQRTWCRGCYYITMYIYIWSRVSCSPPLILNVWYGGYPPPKNHFLDSTIYCKLPGIPFGIMLKKGSCWGAPYIYTHIYIFIYCETMPDRDVPIQKGNTIISSSARVARGSSLRRERP